MSSGRQQVWISCDFHEGRLNKVIENLSGEKSAGKAFTIEKGDGPDVRIVRTPLGHKFKAMKSAKGWLVFRDGGVR